MTLFVWRLLHHPRIGHNLDPGRHRTMTHIFVEGTLLPRASAHLPGELQPFWRLDWSPLNSFLWTCSLGAKLKQSQTSCDQSQLSCQLDGWEANYSTISGRYGRQSLALILSQTSSQQLSYKQFSENLLNNCHKQFSWSQNWLLFTKRLAAFFVPTASRGFPYSSQSVTEGRQTLGQTLKRWIFVWLKKHKVQIVKKDIWTLRLLDTNYAIVHVLFSLFKRS